MGKFLDWLNAESAVGEVLHSRCEEAIKAKEELMRCNSKLSTLKRSCTDFVLKEEMKAKVWLSIERDKWGFLADEMMEQMYNNLPLLVWDSKYENIEFVNKGNWGDWLSDLEGKPYYSHYMPIELPKDMK